MRKSILFTLASIILVFILFNAIVLAQDPWMPLIGAVIGLIFGLILTFTIFRDKKTELKGSEIIKHMLWLSTALAVIIALSFMSSLVGFNTFLGSMLGVFQVFIHKHKYV